MPSHVGASRIDKAYVGTQEVTAVYLGETKVYPNTNTTKWERWSLKWPLATGSESSYSIITSHQKLNWDGTLQASRSHLGGIEEGDVTRIYDIYRYCLSVDGTTRLFKNYSPNVAPTPIQDAYIDTIEDNDESVYPENGVVGDYWYVKM